MDTVNSLNTLNTNNPQNENPPEPKNNDSTKKMPVWGWILVALGASILLFGLVYMIVKSKPNKNNVTNDIFSEVQKENLKKVLPTLPSSFRKFFKSK
jgi:hypothetical protein